MNDYDIRFCPIRNVIARFGDKWSLLIIFTLHNCGKLRYSELQKNIPDVSQKMLTNTLKNLETSHLLTRKAYAEVPPRVEYALTPMGHSLMPVLQNLIDWAKKHYDNVVE